MYLLDTNVVSELRLGRDAKASPSVKAFMESIAPDRTFISVVTVLELEDGMLRKACRDPVQGGIFRDWLELDVLPNFADRTISVDVAIARTAARLRVPDRRNYADALIAATSLEANLTLVTRNVSDFGGIDGLRMVNPWESDTPNG